MAAEPSSASTEKLGAALASRSSLGINRTSSRLFMASKESQHKLLSPSRAISGSENCNPNVISGSCKRKVTKSSTAEQFLESNKHLTSHACAEFNLISPPRKHVCSSKRCASKNPDYAVPATVNPKKLFLTSKRHILPPNGSTSCKCCIRKSKGEDSTANVQNSSMGACNRLCSQDSQNRRWSSDDSVSRNLAGNGVPIVFSCTPSEHNILEYADSGHSKQDFMNEAVGLPASEMAHEECFTDTPKSWNDWPNLQTHHHSETMSKLNCLEGSTSPAASASSRGGCCGSESKGQAADLFAVEGPYCFGASCLNSTSDQSTLAAGDGSTPSPMPENEEAASSPSPEKSGNWRLNAVLQAFGDLSPTREGRVRTLVMAFESLLSVTERKGDEQARKPRCPLKFSYLSSNANLDGEENVYAQREDFVDGDEGESEKEEATDEEERVGQWQSNLSEEDVKDKEIGDQWQSAELVCSQSVVEGKENNEMGEQWLQEQECVGSREKDGMENVSQKQAQEDSTHSVADNKGDVGEECQPIVVVSDEKQSQSHEAEREYGHLLQEGVSEDEFEMRKQEQGFSAQSVVEEDGEEDDKKKKPDEEQAEEGNETDNREKQPSDIVSRQSRKTVLIEGEANKDSASQDLETKHVPALPLNPMVAAYKRQPSNLKIHSNLQQQSSQKFVDGHFSFKAARKQQSNRMRKSLRGSNCSIPSSRPPLAQKSQVQSAQDKPHVSKPQPFKLLTEVRGHIKEQEFLMKLRKILEEEEKLRVPLAQGLPWTTDEPEIPYKPPVKDNTKPLDIHLYSDIRAMERADFDRFIAEKLLYIEQRRTEEECLRRAAEEEEIKKMRQEMVPKAQLMPYFDRPFRPRRSSKRPTIPKEPQFKLHKQQSKRQKCVANSTNSLCM